VDFEGEAGASVSALPPRDRNSTSNAKSPGLGRSQASDGILARAASGQAKALAFRPSRSRHSTISTGIQCVAVSPRMVDKLTVQYFSFSYAPPVIRSVHDSCSQHELIGDVNNPQNPYINHSLGSYTIYNKSVRRSVGGRHYVG
jgi:hypothetical protein